MFKCFVIMPFNSEFDGVYTTIRDAANQAEIVAEKVNVLTGDPITEEMMRKLRGADLVIADLTGSRPNVMWEFGYAKALNKPLVLISQDPFEELPFDVKDYYTIRYDPNSLTSSLRQPLAVSFASTVANIKPAIGRTIEIQKFPTVSSAVAYVTDKLREANCVVDVCVRPDKTEDYGKTLDKFSRRANGFLQRGGKWTQFVGCQYDKQYVNAIYQAIKNLRPDAPGFKCHRLRLDTALINFIILGYESHDEVLFGWGQDEGVFLCRHPDVVNLFNEFTAILKRFSGEIKLLDFIEGPARPEKYLSALKQFWLPHFSNERRTTIIYTAPMFFRVFTDQRRYFIRDIDINDTERAPGKEELKNTLKNHGNWIKTDDKSGFEVSRAYIPSGEAYAKDELLEYFRDCHDYLKRQEFITKTCEFKSKLFHKANWEREPGKINCLIDDNLVFLGNARANFKAWDLLRDFRFRLEDRGISVQNPKDEHREKLKSYIKSDTADRIELRENWDSESMVLVTRGPGLSPGTVATSILANQGQGVHGFIRTFFTTAGGEQRWQELVEKFRLPKPVPSRLQLIFHVILGRDESHCKSCDCLVCDFVD